MNSRLDSALRSRSGGDIQPADELREIQAAFEAHGLTAQRDEAPKFHPNPLEMNRNDSFWRLFEVLFGSYTSPGLGSLVGQKLRMARNVLRDGVLCVRTRL